MFCKLTEKLPWYKNKELLDKFNKLISKSPRLMCLFSNFLSMETLLSIATKLLEALPRTFYSHITRVWADSNTKTLAGLTESAPIDFYSFLSKKSCYRFMTQQNSL